MEIMRTLPDYDMQATIPDHGTTTVVSNAAAVTMQPDAPVSDPHIDRRIGELRLVRKLAEGGMGSVYLARHDVTGASAAVKVLLPSLAKNRSVVQRFFQEARAAQAIEHPGVVEIFGADYDSEGNAYLVMEYLEGESLSARIRREGRLDPAQCESITEQIVSALAAAHALGIVHRDLKPGNIFLCPDADAPGGERVKLLDFGVAKLISNRTPLTRIGDVIGTPLYMAPEQCRADGNIDHRADLYALGCLVYAMLSGRPPFVGDYPGDIICAHLQAPVPPLRMFVPEIGEPMATLVSALLQKDPAKRPPSADQVLAMLQTPVADERSDEAAATAATPRHTPPRAWRRPLVIAAAGLLAALGGAVLLMAT